MRISHITVPTVRPATWHVTVMVVSVLIIGIRFIEDDPGSDDNVVDELIK
jgi:hypothetical protein